MVITFSIGLMIINGSDIGGELYVWKFSRGKSEQWFDDCSSSEWEVDGDIVTPEERANLCGGTNFNILVRYIQFVLNTALYGIRSDQFLDGVRATPANLVLFHLMLIILQVRCLDHRHRATSFFCLFR